MLLHCAEITEQLAEKYLCFSRQAYREIAVSLVRWILVCAQFSLKVRGKCYCNLPQCFTALTRITEQSPCQGQKRYYIFQFLFGLQTPDLTNVTGLLHSSALHYRWVSITETHFISFSVFCSHTGMSLGREKGKHEVHPCWGAISLATLRWKC